MTGESGRGRKKGKAKEETKAKRSKRNEEEGRVYLFVEILEKMEGGMENRECKGRLMLLEKKMGRQLSFEFL